MRIFEAISDSNIGGAGILLMTRLKHTNSQVFQSTVLLPEGSALIERCRELSIPSIEVKGGADRSFSLRTVIAYCKIFRRYRPSLVNCHGSFSARIAARLCGIPCVYTRHCAYPPAKWQTTVLGKRVIGMLQHTFCDRIIAVADAAKQNLIDTGVDSNKITVIINGVDRLQATDREARERLKNELGFPKDSVIVGICARLEPCKGHADLLRAAKQLLQRSPRYRFLIVGSGSCEDVLKAYCHANKISFAVRFVGFQKDVAPYVNLFDIQVNCSVGTETSSLALSEGMSLGIPTVASDYGGNPHMIKHGVNGLIYPAHNENALAKMIETLAEDATLYQALSRGALQRFETEFQAESMVKKTETLYRELLLSKRRD